MSAAVQDGTPLQNQGRARNISPNASRTLGGNANRDNLKRPSMKGFWPAVKETSQAVFSYIGDALQRFGAPPDVMRSNLSTALGIALFSLLIGGIILAYSLFGAREKMTSQIHSHTKPFDKSDLKKSNFVDEEQDFASTIKDKVQDKVKDVKSSLKGQSSRSYAGDNVQQPGESFVDSTLNNLKQKAAPIKDAILTAKDKVAEATGLDSVNLGETSENMMDAAKSKIEDLASSASNMAHKAYDKAWDAASAAKDKVDELTDAAKAKAAKLTGMDLDQDSDDMSPKDKTPSLDSKSTFSSNQKPEDMAMPFKRSKHDLDDTTKPIDDKGAHDKAGLKKH